MKQKVRYRRKTIIVDVPYLIRKGKCQCCGRKGLTNLHHWKYEFKTKEVVKSPMLALKNVSELCFTCHRLADCIRNVCDADKKITNKLNLLKNEN